MTYIVPTYHPAYLLRDATFQIAVISDLEKAIRIAEHGPTLIPKCYRDNQPMPTWAITPDAKTILDWLAAHKGQTLSLDLESTYRDEVMCMGLWPVDRACTEQGLCIPFRKQYGKDYWDSQHDRLRVVCAVFDMLRDPAWPKIGQNIAGFDIPLMKRVWDIETRGLLGDTMVMHSLVMPELPHGLAFLSSIFTDLGAFKRDVHTNESEKDDVNKWEAVQDYADDNLRTYCLLDCFATALTWTALERMAA